MAIGTIRCESGNNKAAGVPHDADALTGRMRDVALQAGDADAARKGKSILEKVAVGLEH